MMRILAITAIAIAAATAPAMAQTSTGAAKSQAECEADWMAADKNTDGKLDAAEVEASKAMMPTALTATGDVMQTDFMTACTTASTTTQ